MAPLLFMLRHVAYATDVVIIPSRDPSSMLQTLNEKIQGWPAIIILGIAVFAMSFFGIEGYFSAHIDSSVAKVGKHEISQQQFRERVNQIRRQAILQEGTRFDGAAFDKPANKRRILDGMIDQQLFLQANARLGMHVSNQTLRSLIAAVPLFQENGTFNAETYRSILREHGLTPAMYEALQRTNLALQQLPDAIGTTTLVTTADVERLFRLQHQRRDLRYVELPQPKLSKFEPSHEEIVRYYKQHGADFMRPEQVSLQYIELHASNIHHATPSEAALKKRYTATKSRFVQPAQQLVSHILIQLPAHATAKQRKQVLAKVNHIAKIVTPANFASLARKDSDDLGSKMQGGSLGWLEKGVTGAVFSKALAGLKKGDISKPVRTQDGYHIIYLRDSKPATGKSFAQVRTQLSRDMTREALDRKFNEVAGKLTDLSYQMPGSLDSAASALHLPVQTTGFFSRHGGSGITANPKLIKAAFSNDVLVQGSNSNLIELGPHDAVVVRLAKHKPAAELPLTQVLGIIKQKILSARLIQHARQHTDQLLHRLRQGASMQSLASSMHARVHTVKGVMRDRLDNALKHASAAKNLPEAVRQAAFKLPHPTASQQYPQYSSVSMGKGIFAILAVDRVYNDDTMKLTPNQRDQLRKQMHDTYAILATRAYLNLLKAGTKITINMDHM